MPTDHPSGEDLLQYLSGAVPNLSIAEHIDVCADCAYVAMVIGELKDLAEAGCLLPLSPDEAECMRLSFREIGAETRFSRKPARGNGPTVLASLCGAMGMAFRHGVFAEAALAQGEETDDESVRNSVGHSSESRRAGDGQHADAQEDAMTRNEQDSDGTTTANWSSPFDRAFGEGDASSPIAAPDPMIGTPQQDAHDWAGQQHFQDTCAIRCQEYLITQFTGHDPGEVNLVQEAAAHGWYHPGEGTSVENVGNLLVEHGIAVNRYQHANIFHLSNELAQGHKVIVGVHSEGLWQQHPILDEITDKLGLNQADHAVVVSGIDTSDPDHVQVIISDPGTGQAVAHYPMEQFVSAWKDSDFFMVATQDPPPPEANLPEMAHFNYGLGHVDQVWGQSYGDFLALADRPDLWPEHHHESHPDQEPTLLPDEPCSFGPDDASDGHHHHEFDDSQCDHPHDSDHGTSESGESVFDDFLHHD